jgi:putative ABC transport system substrate-binding protein
MTLDCAGGADRIDCADAGSREKRMVTRRNVVLSLGAGVLAAPFAGLAQAERQFRVGILATGNRHGSAHLYAAFTRALKDLGYVENESIAFESRYADGNLDQLAGLAADLIKARVDILFAPNSPAVRAARQASVTTPIVFAVVDDPVARGFVKSLAQPGGNITGVLSIAPKLNNERFQALKQAVPKVSHLAMAIAREPSATSQVATQITDLRRAAESNGMDMLSIEIRSRKSFDEAADLLSKWRADAMSCLDSAYNFYNRAVLVEFAAKMKLPAIYPSSEYVDAGGLMSYGANTEWNYRHAATFIDRILKGAKAAALPVEAPTRLELALNVGAAKQLGLQFPAALLKKANRLTG